MQSLLEGLAKKVGALERAIVDGGAGTTEMSVELYLAWSRQTRYPR